MRPLVRSRSLRRRFGNKESDTVVSGRCPCSDHYEWSLLDEDLAISVSELNRFLFGDFSKPMRHFLEHDRNFQSEYITELFYTDVKRRNNYIDHNNKKSHIPCNKRNPYLISSV